MVLHRHDLHLLAAQPVRQVQQCRGDRGVLADLLNPPAGAGVVRNPDAGEQAGLTDIDRAHPADLLAPLADLLHDLAPLL